MLSLSDPLLWLVRSILWELYELNFLYELYMLDRAIVPDRWCKGVSPLGNDH